GGERAEEVAHQHVERRYGRRAAECVHAGLIAAPLGYLDQPRAEDALRFGPIPRPGRLAPGAPQLPGERPAPVDPPRAGAEHEQPSPPTPPPGLRPAHAPLLRRGSSAARASLSDWNGAPVVGAPRRLVGTAGTGAGVAGALRTSHSARKASSQSRR